MQQLKNKKIYEDLKNSLDNKIRIFSIIRGVIFISFLIFFILFLSSNYNLIDLYISLFFLISFILFVSLTKKYYLDRNYYENVILDYEKHEYRKNGKFNNAKYFYDKGLDFKRKYSKTSLRDKYLIEDIDIFGNNSLYQNISSAKSVLGRNKLADSLINGHKYYEQRINNNFSQEVYDLGNSEDICLINGALSLNKIEESINYDTYLDNLSMKFTIDSKKRNTLITLLIIDILIVILSFTVFSPLFLMIIPMLNIFVSFNLKDEIDLINSTNIYNSIENNLKVFSYLNKIDNKLLKEKFDFNDDLKTFKRLINLWQFLSYKNNFIFKLIFNFIYCFDGLFQIIYNRLIPNKEEIAQTLNKLADLEVLVSFGNLVSDYNTCIPTVSDKLEFENLSNPLIKNCVANTFSYNRGVVLTGSNMSGKTTFMRTIALNLLLFVSGSVVLADKFSSKLYYLYTSLRIKDEMSEGVSTFYAEIEKIREMLNKDEVTKLCLIDEIFKGTNTLDRVYGATKLIEKLEKENYDFIISTHDFELCNINTIDNYHFSEHYNEDYSQILFDYKLKNGKSESTNALFLLKMSGIIE